MQEQNTTLDKLEKGQRFDGMLLVKQSEVRVSQNGSRFLDAVLCDRTRELNAKAWDWGQNPAPEAMSVVSVKAVANEFMGKIQLKIDSIKPAAPNAAQLRMLVPGAPENPDKMLTDVLDTIDSMTNDDIGLLCAAIIDENREKLLYWPAAVSYHHSERGGLLHHTTTMLRAAGALLPVYPFLDADLLTAGVILHDVCKLRELDASALGLAGEYSKEGLLLGHITMGVAYVLETAKRLEINYETGLLLAHMILSHHSEPEYGSPRRPMFAEAELLHYLDTIDARMFDMRTHLSQTDPGGFSGFIRSLENRRLYRHDRFESDV